MDEAFCLDACTKEGSLQGKGKKVLLNVVGKGVNHQEDAVALLSSTSRNAADTEVLAIDGRLSWLGLTACRPI